MSLLAVKDLSIAFDIVGKGALTAVDGISFAIEAGETVGLVGESGCGKTITALSLLRLIDPPGRITGGKIHLVGKDLLALPEREMRRVRGREIAMIFQDPMTSLNPVFTVGGQIAEVFRIHQGLSRHEAEREAVRILGAVHIPDPEARVREYPHQLSGGMRQRVMIAMALACKPRLLVADEPTTALDVTIQAQILDLLQELRVARGMAVLLITHDLGVVSAVCDRVLVMYAGRLVEEAVAKDLFVDPRHPYTRGLLASLPRLGERVERLHAIAGTVPPLGEFSTACRFNPRCPHVFDRCRIEDPFLVGRVPEHRAACFLEDQHA